MNVRPPHARTTLVAAALYLLLALACTQIPLFDHPGFEFSFILAVIASVTAGFVTLARVAPRYRTGDGEERLPVLRVYFSSLAINLALLLIPLALILLNGFFVPLCDVQEGLAFFLLLPLPGVAFATALALFSVVHYRRGRTMFVIYALVTIGYAVYTGYTTPAIFSYNFFYGFFPGLSYDELLPLEMPLILFRLLTLGVTAVLLWWTSLIVRATVPEDGAVRKGFTLARTLWRDHPIPFLGMIVAAGLFFWFRCELGWESTASYIQGRLGGVRETEHFVIHYDSTIVDAHSADRIAAEHEFQLARIQELFVLPHIARISSYIYPSTEAKRRLVGAGITELAKPWNREVHITMQGMDATLKHELVHVVAEPFGLPVIGASSSPGLIEGLAVAVEGTWGYRTLAQNAVMLRRAGLMPDIERMMSATGFAAQSSAVSYVLAGAFSRHLIDRYGLRRFLQVYGPKSYAEVYGASLPMLIAGWKASLDSVAVDPSDTVAVDVFFRRPPLLGNVCVRLHARRVREAQRLFSERRYDEALALYSTLTTHGGGYDAFAGLMVTLHRKRASAAVADLYDSLVSHDAHPHRYLPLALTAGDAAWADGNTIRARDLYAKVRAANVTPSLTELATIRLLAMNDPASAPEFLTYFQGDVSDTVRAGMFSRSPGPGLDSLGWYLRGRALYRIGRYADARLLFERAAFVGTDHLLESRRLIALGEASLRDGYPERARSAYWLVLNYDAREAIALDMDERIARCEFLRRWK
jgi:tetratricopeptide (TPR) repeat protein